MQQKLLCCLQIMESQDSSPHLRVTELWQSVIFELIPHAPKRREGWHCFLSTASIVWIAYNGRKGSCGERMGKPVKCYSHWSCREEKQADLQTEWWSCKCRGRAIFQCHLHSLKEGSMHIIEVNAAGSVEHCISTYIMVSFISYTWVSLSAQCDGSCVANFVCLQNLSPWRKVPEQIKGRRRVEGWRLASHWDAPQKIEEGSCRIGS